MWFRAKADRTVTTRVLMVCMGNICRSPTAEAVLSHKLKAAGLDKAVEVDSAGTYGGHVGEPPDARAQRHAKLRGYDLSRLRARRLTAADFARFDWVIAMDEDNLSRIEDMAPEGHGACLTLLMAHSGRGFWYDRAYFLAKLHANVYMEISGLPPQRLLDYFPELERVADKVIFGTDWPGMPYIKRNIELIRALPLKKETTDKILGGNAARILGIEATGRGMGHA
jgi:protein-tyrosine-phosphatase